MALLDFDDNDLAVLNQALMQMPYGAVAPLIAKINTQIREQTPAAEQPSETVPEPSA